MFDVRAGSEGRLSLIAAGCHGGRARGATSPAPSSSRTAARTFAP